MKQVDWIEVSRLNHF